MRFSPDEITSVLKTELERRKAGFLGAYPQFAGLLNPKGGK